MDFKRIRLNTFPTKVDSQNPEMMQAVFKWPSPDFSDDELQEFSDKEIAEAQFDEVSPYEVIHDLGHNVTMLEVFLQLDIEDEEQFKDFVEKYGVKATLYNLRTKKKVKRDWGCLEQFVFDSDRYDPSIGMDYAIIGTEALEGIRLEVIDAFKTAQGDLESTIKSWEAGQEETFLVNANRYLQDHCRLRIIRKLYPASRLEGGSPESENKLKADDSTIPAPYGAEYAEGIVKSARLKMESVPYEYMIPVIEPLDIVGDAFLDFLDILVARKTGQHRNIYCAYCGNLLPAGKRNRRYCGKGCADRSAQTHPMYKLRKYYRKKLDTGTITRGQWDELNDKLTDIKKRYDQGSITGDAAEKEIREFAASIGIRRRPRGRPKK